MTFSWKGPEFDENFFDPKKSRYYPFGFVYNRSEMRDMIIDYLDWFTTDYPICKNIITLLEEIIQFRSATSAMVIGTKPEFRLKTEAELAKAFDIVAENIQSAEKHLQTMNPQSKEYKFFASAIRYCVESIGERLEELAKDKNDIYTHYWQGSLLQKVLKIQKLGNEDVVRNA